MDRARGSTRFALALIGVFAIIASVLASVGICGVLSTVVRQRTSEIGVRMTFGAERRNIFRLFVGQGLRLIGLATFACWLPARRVAALNPTAVLREE